MSNYIEVNNESGKVIINDSFQMFSLIEKLNYNLNHSFAINPSRELYAFKPNRPDIVFTADIGNNGNSTFFAPAVLSDESIANQSLECYKFGLQAKSTNFGLEVFNENGNQIFASQLNYMKVIDFISVEVRDMRDNAFIRSYDRRIAVVPISVPFYYVFDGDDEFAQDEPYHIDTMGLYFPNENTISVRLIENVNNDVGVFIYNVNDNYLLQLLVIDATGL